MWQERVNRENRGLASVAPGTSVGEAIAPATNSISRAAASEFSLDFSGVQIPPGRYLTGSELDAAVHSFLDELETA
jgi:hypothetical protein